MVEQEMKNVNCLVAYLWEMIKTYCPIHCQQYSIQMKSLMQFQLHRRSLSSH